MIMQQFLSTDAANRLGWTLLHSIWEGAAIGAGLFAALVVLRTRSPQTRYAASTSALAIMLLAIGATFYRTAVPMASGLQKRVGASVAMNVENTSTAIFNVGRNLIGPDQLAPIQAPASKSPINLESHLSLVERSAWLIPWLAAAWALGVMLLGLWHVGGWIAAQRLRVLGVGPVDAVVSAMVEKLAGRLKLSRRVRIVQSLLAQTPLVIGWLRPIVLLPVSVLSGLTAQQLEAVLAHELAHVRRNDYLVNLFQIVAETLLFYHPVVWWISRSIRLEREQCCDDMAIESCGDRIRFVESLARLEEVRLNGAIALAARGSGGEELLHRIQRLLGIKVDRPRQNARALPGAILIALVLGAIAFHSTKRVAAADAPKPIAPEKKFTTTNPAPPARKMYVIHCEVIELKAGVETILSSPRLMLDEGQVGECTIGSAALAGDEKPELQMNAGTSMKIRVMGAADGKLQAFIRFAQSERVNGKETDPTIREVGVRTIRLVQPGERFQVRIDDARSLRLKIEAGLIAHVDEVNAKREAMVRNAMSTSRPADSDSAHRKVLEVALEQAKIVANQKELAYRNGVGTMLGVMNAREDCDVLEAELNGDEIQVAKVRLEAAQHRFDLTSKRHEAGVATVAEFQKAKGEVEVADAQWGEAQLRAKLRGNDTLVRVQDSRLLVTSPNGKVVRCDSFLIDQDGKPTEKLTVFNGMVQLETANTTLRAAEMRFPSLVGKAE